MMNTYVQKIKTLLNFERNMIADSVETKGTDERP